MTVNDWCKTIHEWAKGKGFWPEGEERNKGEICALIHSEVSELLEGLRKPGPSDHVPELTLVEEELADIAIRLFDCSGGWGIDLENAIKLKHEYNKSRPHKHGKKF